MSELYGADGPPAAELAQIPLGRMGTPREFGDVVCFLASDAGRLRDRDDRPGRRRHFAVAAVKRRLDSRPHPGARARAARGGARAAGHPVQPVRVPPGPRPSGRAARHRPGRQGPDRAAASTSSTSSCGRRRCSSGSSAACTTAPTSTRPSAVNPPGVGEQQRRQIDLQDMQRSQEIAAAVALRAAGKKVVLRPIGARVAFVEAGQARGREARARRRDRRRRRHSRPRPEATSSRRMRKTAVGDFVRFTVRRGKQSLVIPIKTVAADSGPRRRRSSACSSSRRSTSTCRSTCGSTRATSAAPRPALAFALEVMEELGRDVVHGHRVAATGEIFPDGSVGPIGGIKQKTIGARQAHVDAFLVPAGDNARDAKKHAARPPHPPCGELFTGVACPGDTRSERLEQRRFRPLSNVPETARFPF